jgi:hypothetical protein
VTAVAVGDNVVWASVPSGALVVAEADEDLYAMRLGNRGVYVGGPASWAGFKVEAAEFGTWTWQGFGTVKVVALSLTGNETGEELRALVSHTP